jgi:hypothetical protein
LVDPTKTIASANIAGTCNHPGTANAIASARQATGKTCWPNLGAIRGENNMVIVAAIGVARISEPNAASPAPSIALVSGIRAA